MSDTEMNDSDEKAETLETPQNEAEVQSISEYKNSLSQALLSTEHSWVQHGRKVEQNERKTYSSMLVTDDTGQLCKSQIVLPGGKSKSLPQTVKTHLSKEKIQGGRLTDDDMLVSVECSAWWHESAQNDFASELFKGVEKPKILIMDNLGLHRKDNFHKALQRSNILPVLGGARITGVAQVNDRLLNALVDSGIKTMSHQYFEKTGNTQSAPLDKQVLFHRTVKKHINANEKITQAIAMDYKVTGFSQSFDLSETHLFLKDLNENNPLFQPATEVPGLTLLPDEVTKKLHGHSPCEAPASMILQMPKKSGKKVTPSGKQTTNLSL